MNDIGVCYLNLEQPEKAEPYFRKAVAADDVFVMPRINLAAILFAAQNVPEAEQQYRRCLKLEPHQIEAKIGLASCLASQGQLKPAIALFEEVLLTHPNRKDVQQNLDMARGMLKSQ